MTAVNDPVLALPILIAAVLTGHRDIQRVVLVDPDAARAAELRPLIEEASVLVENLNATVASIGDEEPPLRIDGEAMRS